MSWTMILLYAVGIGAGLTFLFFTVRNIMFAILNFVGKHAQ